MKGGTNKIASSPPALQRGLSIYSLPGALVSVLWFFAVPALCKPLWTTVFSNFSSPQMAEVFLWSVVAPYYLIYVLIVALPPYLLGWEFFEQYKISNDPWPWKDERESVRKEFWKLTYKSVWLDFFNICIGVPGCVYTKTILFPHRSMSFSIDDWPTQWELFVGVMAVVYVSEFGFYWTHRIMHAYPKLYQFHKFHHQYNQNNVLSAQYFHPIDFVFSIAAPVIATNTIIRPHGVTQLVAGLWIFTANLDDHLGYAFPWSPVRWFPFSAGTDAHEFHHSHNKGCFGSKLSIWDSAFGTDRAYNEWRKKRWSKE